MLKLHNNKTVAGTVTLIGTRGSAESPIPEATKKQFHCLTLWLIDNHFLGRSGSAGGMDWICENAANQSSDPSAFTSFLPWPGFGPPTKVKRIVGKHLPNWLQAQEIARSVVSWWERVPSSFQCLYGRNVYQVLGEDLITKSDFCVYWTPIVKGKIKGGTSVAVNLCAKYDIPSFNLYDPDNFDLLKAHVLATTGLDLDLNPYSDIYYSSVSEPYNYKKVEI